MLLMELTQRRVHDFHISQALHILTTSYVKAQHHQRAISVYEEEGYDSYVKYCELKTIIYLDKD